ncbi:hypothetical protein AUC68_14690 [Methyloceanibacter methanicus]|uniref:Polysaccharide biosynthesis protein C-terminal domain-containing protein n=1 Tax=Methyloceanibacter methanicus TaxID=1774968 RepID=A0A1E3W3W6_9HYPH|nr:hypothetical protein AUC68_14690 [Methyloceanibacter methanicus]
MLGSVSTLAVKACGSALAFIMFALAARQMNPDAFGQLAVVFNTLSFIAIAMNFGQEVLIARSWGEYAGTSPSLARGALQFGARIVLYGATLSSLAVVLYWFLSGSAPGPWFAASAGLFLFAQTLTTFTSRLSLVVSGVALAEIPREFLWRTTVIVAILVIAGTGASFTATEFFLVSGAILLVSVFGQWLRIRQVIPAAVREAEPQFERDLWRRRSSRMWPSALLDSSSQYLEVVVVGFILGPAAAAFYFAATRITNAFAMIASGLTTYATRHISLLFHNDSTAELQSMLRSLAIVSLLLSGAIVGVIVVAGKLLLSFYGAPYVDIYPVLVILTLGGLLTGLAGPAPHLLLLTGHERLYPVVMTTALILRMSSIALLGTLFGLTGAAIAGAAATALTAGALVVACRRFIRIDPSVLSLFQQKALAELAQPGEGPNLAKSERA